jgi:hypothetical protein
MSLTIAHSTAPAKISMNSVAICCLPVNETLQWAPVSAKTLVSNPAQPGGTTTADPSRRRIARRRPLPNGRAVVGACLMTVAAAGAFLSYTGAARGPTTAYAVVDGPADAGTALDASTVRFVPMELAEEVAAGAFVDLSELRGRLLVTPLLDGDLIQLSAVSAPDAGPEPAHEVALDVPRGAAVDARITAGDLVDVYATYNTSTTELVIERAEVVQVPATTDGALTDGLEHVVVIRVLTADDVPAVVHAARAGDVTLVRSTFATDTGRPPTTYRPQHDAG